MEVWVWLTAYLVGFALLQLLLYRYLRRGESTHERGSEAPEPGYRRLEGAATAGGAGGDGGQDGTVCGHCGTVNERHGTYSYCRECVEPLR